jgi:hypothetical protein
MTLRTQILYNCLPEIWPILLCTYVHPQLGADEVIGFSHGQLVTASYEKGEGLVHFVTNVRMTTLISLQSDMWFLWKLKL